MNIQKGKVVKNCEWSAATQKKLASMLGVSAMLSAVALTACDYGTTSGSVVVPEVSSSFEDLPPESGVVEPPEPTCGDLPCDEPHSSSSSIRLDSLEITSGEIIPPFESSSSSEEEFPPQAGILPPEPEAGSPFDQFYDSSSSSSEPEYPPLAGVVTIQESSSSEALPSSSSDEIDSTLTAGLPVIEEPEPLSGDVAEPDVIYIDDPKN